MRRRKALRSATNQGKYDDAIDVDNNDNDDDDDDEYDHGDIRPHIAHLQNTRDFAFPKPSATDDEEDYDTTFYVATPVAKLPGTQQLFSRLARAQVDAGTVDEENGDESYDKETQLGI
jgi:hypothetical protein